MKFTCSLAIFAVLGVQAVEVSVTPVQKVIQLLDGMLAKGKAEKHDEQVQFATYKQFCDDTTVEKTRAISEAEEQIEVLKADIQKYASDSATLTREIAGHNEDISVWSGDTKAATKVRAIENTDYDNLHKDYSESVDALERAIAVLKKQGYDRTQSSFSQLSTLQDMTLIPKQAKAAIESFLAQDPQTGLEVAAPDAYGYEFQSHGIIDMLEKLLDKFITERTELEKTEMNSKHAFDMLMQDLKAQIDQATADVSTKSETKAKKLQAKATAAGDLTDTTTTKNDDSKYLSDLTALCEQKATDFESRQQLRAEEIEAIEKAIEILSSDSVSGNAVKYLPTMLQKSSSALAQLAVNTHAGSQARAGVYLNEQAKRLNSRVLFALATRVADDPFVKVKKMIKDLIVRLMEEANEEATHKGWCDTELSTNEQTRKEKTEAVETLHAEIDELEASIAKLMEDISELTNAVADLNAAMAKATEIRQEEKATNTATVKDSQEAQTAVAQAVTVLKEFYSKAGEATAFMQQNQQPVAPAIFDSPYKGLQAENGGVIGMLEVIQADFARLEADTKASEATSQKEYDGFMTDSKVDKEAKKHRHRAQNSEETR
jgi:chromosome segregation ATPase